MEVVTMKSKELAPSEVRKLICDQHRDIERRIAEIELLMQGPDRPIEKTVGAMHEFTQYFLSHVDQEERILLPVLKDIDAWGDVRVDRMKAEHVEQRAQVKSLLARLKTEPSNEVKADIRAFFASLRKDIELEEAEHVHPDVMKDDPVTVKNFIG